MLKNNQRINLLSANLMDFADHIAKSCVRFALGNDAQFATQWENTGRLSQVQLLEAMHAALVADEESLHFAYLQMHTRCAGIFAQMIEDCEDENMPQ